MTALKYKTTPYAHQLNYQTRFGRFKAAALLAEMGTGKTKMLIDNFSDLWLAREIESVLIFAPNGVHTTWVYDEIPKHCPDWVNYKALRWSANNTAKFKKELQLFYNTSSERKLRIFAFNWEALQHKRSFEEIERFCKSAGALMIICDESDAIKNPSAIRTKRLMQIKKYSKYRRISTGSPINNAPFDAFAQYEFLDTTILRTSSYAAFKATYAELLGADSQLVKNIVIKNDMRGIPQIVKRDKDGSPIYKNLDRLGKLIQPYSFRVLKSECLDLPEKIYKNVYYEMTPAQSALYREAIKECRLEGEPFHKLTKLMKTSQITSGFFIPPKINEIRRIEGDNPKLLALKEIVASTNLECNQAIIWARFRAEIADISRAIKEMGFTCAEYHGDTSLDERKRIVKEFQEGKIQFFIGNQQAAGTGLTLTNASVVVYYSNNWSLRDRLQSEDRAHRIGQTKSVVYIDLICKKTVDELIIKSLVNKQEVASDILQIFAKNEKYLTEL